MRNALVKLTSLTVFLFVLGIAVFIAASPRPSVQVFEASRPRLLSASNASLQREAYDTQGTISVSAGAALGNELPLPGKGEVDFVSIVYTTDTASSFSLQLRLSGLTTPVDYFGANSELSTGTLVETFFPGPGDAPYSAGDYLTLYADNDTTPDLNLEDVAVTVGLRVLYAEEGVDFTSTEYRITIGSRNATYASDYSGEETSTGLIFIDGVSYTRDATAISNALAAGFIIQALSD